MNILEEFQYQLQRLDRTIHIATTTKPQPSFKEKLYKSRKQRMEYYSKLIKQSRRKALRIDIKKK